MLRILQYTALLVAISALVIAASILLPLQSAPLQSKRQNLSLNHINIVDVQNGEVLRNMTVLVSDGRIVEIMPSEQYLSPAGFMDVDGSGKFLIPGLWDMHTHGIKRSPQIHHPLFIRYGITSVRDMSGCLSEDDSYWACPKDRDLWTSQALNGKGISPRYILQSSYQTNGGNEVPVSFPDFFRLGSETDASKLVQFYAGKNIDFIKTYTELDAEQFQNLAHASKEMNIQLAGHKPLRVSLSSAIAAGMTSIEHGRLFLFECYQDIASFRQLNNPVSQYNAELMRQMLLAQDELKCTSEMKAMADSDTAWVPTLTTLQMSAMANDRIFRQDERLKVIPPLFQYLIWNPDIQRAASKGYDQKHLFVHADFFAMAKSQVGKAQSLGVTIMAGTDNLDTYVFTGSSLHDELSMLVDSGLSPLQALQSATLIPAGFARLDNELGTIEVGKRADMIILNSNPLIDIRNTLDIDSVIFAGRYIDEKALESLEKYVADMAGSIRLNLRLLWDMLTSPLMRVQLAD